MSQQPETPAAEDDISVVALLQHYNLHDLEKYLPNHRQDQRPVRSCGVHSME